MKNTLRQWREKRQFSQTELAAIVGVQAQTIGNIENAKHTPHTRTRRKLAEALNVPLEQLFFEEDDEQPHQLAS